MAADGHRDGVPAETDNLLTQFTNAISDLGPSELQDVLQRVLAARAVSADPFNRTPSPSRRRPRRGNVLTYRVRIDLNETQPPWRRLELASDLYLDDLDAVIQTAFRWTDSHLHRFGSGPE